MNEKLEPKKKEAQSVLDAFNDELEHLKETDDFLGEVTGRIAGYSTQEKPDDPKDMVSALPFLSAVKNRIDTLRMIKLSIKDKVDYLKSIF